jgi:hypothetical protein
MLGYRFCKALKVKNYFNSSKRFYEFLSRSAKWMAIEFEGKNFPSPPARMPGLLCTNKGKHNIKHVPFLTSATA